MLTQSVNNGFESQAISGSGIDVTLAGENYLSIAVQTITAHPINLASSNVTGVLPIANGGTGASTASGARTNLGLGTMAVQDANNVAITGGSITGMPTPTNPSDVATKAYADLFIPLTQKGANNGVATLDSGGKVPVAQLPNSVMEYKGTWSAATNTPTLTNGTGNAGDVYINTAVGTVDFGAGGITFAVGDWVIYNGSTWEKSINSNAVVSVNGQTGAVVFTAGTGLSLTGTQYSIDSTVVTLTGTQALSNKTLDNSNTITVKDTLFTLQDDADATKQVKLHAENVSTGTTRDWFFPDSSDAFVGINTPQSLASKILVSSTIGNTNVVTLKDNSFTLQDDADTTKQAVFQLSGITTATTRTYTVPNASGTLALTSDLTGYVTSVSGTSNRITSTGGTTPVIDIAATYVGQTSITTLGTIGTGTWQGTAVAATFGGTGQTSYTIGDLLYASTTSALSKLADVATGNALISGGVATAPSWGKIGLTTHVSGVLAEANGGTNQSTYSQGDLLYASAANTLSKLAKDTNATRYLSNTGTSNNPAWAQVNLANGVTGTLPVGNGGTGQTTLTAHGVLLGNTTSGINATSAGTAGQVLVSGGASADPTWGTRGGAVIKFSLSTAGSWTANGYLGVDTDGSSTLAANIVPWVVPAAGTLFNLRIGALSNAPSTLHILIYKASNAASPSYSATALDATVTNATNNGNDTTHTVSVNAGDMIVAFSNTTWNTNGICVTCMYVPT